MSGERSEGCDELTESTVARSGSGRQRDGAGKLKVVVRKTPRWKIESRTTAGSGSSQVGGRQKVTEGEKLRAQRPRRVKPVVLTPS